ncbi:MAG TPA: TIGR04076 family protein [candidate division Zixibacteria bacterium]|nr:TIGR04076 family protein [candidate division Zixibacteria bacterium]
MPKYKVKITVQKKFSPEQVFGEKFYSPSGKEIVNCGYKEGQEFIVGDTGDMPEGFCHHAWYGIYKKVEFIQYGGNFDDWAGEGVDYGVCPDGIRPIVFKIERFERINE